MVMLTKEKQQIECNEPKIMRAITDKEWAYILKGRTLEFGQLTVFYENRSPTRVKKEESERL